MSLQKWIMAAAFDRLYDFLGVAVFFCKFDTLFLAGVFTASSANFCHRCSSSLVTDVSLLTGTMLVIEISSSVYCILYL